MLKQLIKYTSIQTFGKIITIFISLGTTAWLTRKLGLNDYGLLTFVSSIFLLVDSVADFGTRTNGVREISAAKDVESRKKIWINIALLRKIMTGVAFFFGLLMVFLYPGFEGFRFWSLVALSMSWLTSVAGDEEIIFQSGSRLDLKTIIDIVYPAGFFIFILIFGKYLNLGLVFSGYLLSRIISLCIGWKLINFHFSDYNFKFTKQIDWLLIKKILYESWPIGLYMLIFTAYDRAIDATLIRHFWGEINVAQYGLAYKIYSNLVIPAYFLVSSVFPAMSKNEHKNITKKTLCVAGLMLLGIVPLVYFFAPLMINLLAGKEYLAAVPVLKVLSFAIVFAYFGHVLGFRLIAKGNQKYLLLIAIVALLINTGLNVYLIPRFGMIAGAWVTVITEAFMVTLFGWRLFKSNHNDKLIGLV